MRITVDVVVPLVLIVLLIFGAVYGHHVVSYRPWVQDAHQFVQE